jgi:predicted RNA-binding protein with RPS1 domain
LTNSELSEIDGLFVCQNDETITFEKAKDCCDYDYESGECYDLESISTTYLNEETTDYTNYSDYTDYIDINGTNYSDYIQYSSSNIVNTHTSIPTQIININNPTAILLGFSKFNMLVSSFTFWIHFINIRDFIYSSKLIFSVEVINKSLLRMLDTKEANCTKDDSIKDTASYLCEVSAETANIGQIKANTDFNFSSQNVSVIGISPVANAYINNIQNVGNEDLNLTVYILDHSTINKSEIDLTYNISGIIEGNKTPGFKEVILQVNSEDDDNTFKDVENVNCNLVNKENNSYILNCKGKKNVNYNLKSATYNNGS